MQLLFISNNIGAQSDCRNYAVFMAWITLDISGVSHVISCVVSPLISHAMFYHIISLLALYCKLFHKLVP